MKIRFETTIDDILAFNRYHCDHSPLVRRQRFILTAVGPVIGAVLAVILYFRALDELLDRPLAFLIFGLAIFGVLAPVTVLSYFLMLWWHRYQMTSSVRKLLAEGSNRTLLGWREMELVNGRLVIRTELIESSMDLRAITKIVGNDQYTFIYLAAIQAYLVPMHLYPEEEYRAFIDDLIDAWENREAPRPIKEETEPKSPQPADPRIVEKPL